MRALFFTLLLTSCLQAEVQPQTKIQHTLQNLESELSYLRQKIDNQEVRIETMREEVSKLLKATKEATTSQNAASEQKVQRVEKSLEKFVADMKQFKTHANETSELVKELQKALLHATETTQAQAKQLEGLQGALQSVVKAMQVETKGTQKSYIVKKGDTLDKIAKEFHTTVSALKKANNISSSTIQKDQFLLIPQGTSE
jgi:peptidoglycan DL-endopeptidase CwlS